MTRVIVAAVAGMFVAGTCLAGTSRAGSGELEVNPPSLRREILGELIKLKVEVESGSGIRGEFDLVCTSSTYQGEYSKKNQRGSLRMAISGVIAKMNQGKFLISYDLEVRLENSSGLTRSSAAGSVLLSEGRPTKIVSIGGSSVTMTASTINRSTDVTQ